MKPNCIKCECELTTVNRSPGRNTCKACILKKNRERNAKIRETLKEKECCECGVVKKTSLFKSASHKKCCECSKKNFVLISKEEYDKLHPNEKRVCLICKKEKENKEFKYHTNNYRNNCSLCTNNSENIVCLTYYNHYIEKTKVGILTDSCYTKEEFYELVKTFIERECSYCGIIQEHIKNGIDRIDSNLNYSYSNCITCCSACNKMKKDMDIGSFIRKVTEIYSKSHNLEIAVEEVLVNRTISSYNKYKRNALSREISFNLTKEEFENIVSRECYLCGVSKPGYIGIDRINNDIGYTKNNVEPCCKYCNLMKFDINLDTFKSKISDIYSYITDNQKIKDLCSTSRFNDIFSKIKEYQENLDDYTSGFLEAGINITTTNKCLKIQIVNKDQKVLDFISQNTHGYFKKKDNMMNVSSENKKKFLDLVKDNFLNKEVIKHSLNLLNCSTYEKENICKLIAIENTDIHELSLEYIAGVFDINGCINDSSISISHRQKNILNSMNILYEKIYVRDRLYVYDTQTQIKFLQDITPYLHFKKDEVRDYIKKISPKKTDKEILEILVKDLKENYTPEELLLYNKSVEIENTSDNVEYNNLIFNDFDVVNALNIDLHFCYSNEQIKKWKYYRDKTSSICNNGSVGRSMKILVFDKMSKKYIGVLSIGSDGYNNTRRDAYIKNTYPDLNIENYLNYVGNISTCVPLQPFGYNCNGGKLLVMLAFSRRVYTEWLDKYGQPLLILTTMGINGKSIMYDRLNCLKFVGFTQGKSAYHIPEEFLKTANNVIKNSTSSLQNRVGRSEKLRALCKTIGINEACLSHNMKKGVYFGWVFSTKLDENYDETKLKRVSEITKEWYDRWCVNRLNRIELQKEIKIYTPEDFKDIKKYELPNFY